jgi:glycerophosphoryl diester phosphodiesterase
VRPLIISHAACGGHAPENTLAGIRKAIDLGADAIEIDVQASSDHEPVLMHDLTVDRTTHGTGPLASMTLSQLRALDVGGEPVPTLAEVLEQTKGRVLLIMEIKAPGIEQDVVRAVQQANALEDVMAWSFFPQAIEGMRTADARIPCALLVAGEYMNKWGDMRTRAITLGAQGVSVFYPGVDERVDEDCRRSGLALYTWTPDSRKEIARLAKLGVDGICSNFPDKVSDVLANPRP